MSWKQDMMHFISRTISDPKMKILTWKLRRSDDDHGLLEMLRERISKRSHRLAYLDTTLPEYDPWNDDWRNLILLSDIKFLGRALEDLYPDSIDRMITILENEPKNSVFVMELFHLLSNIQEKRALPTLIRLLHEETDPDEISELLWFVGKFGRVGEVVDRNQPLGLIRYFDYDRKAYYAYLDDEDREKELQEWRMELVPVIEPFLTHSNERVKITAFIAIRKIIPFGEHPMLVEFEKTNPDLDYEEMRLEYDPPSCFQPGKDVEKAESS